MGEVCDFLRFDLLGYVGALGIFLFAGWRCWLGDTLLELSELATCKQKLNDWLSLHLLDEKLSLYQPSKQVSDAMTAKVH